MLSKIPVVAIRGPGRKYLLIQVTDDSRKRTLFLRADTDSSFHRDILAKFEKEIMVTDPNVKIFPLGGGKILLNHIAKTIKLWGWSTEFGPSPDTAVVGRMLAREFAGYKVLFDKKRSEK
ncbi:hypothetical protein EPN83_00385 [Patescibacteria group bacterium]|nr:MAG: hypothetical protein EPN83_00385 [Patescibacteria group bacterium]